MAAQKYQDKIKEKQQLLTRISDMISYLYFMESAALRSCKQGSQIQLDLTRLYIAEKLPLIQQSIKEVVAHCSDLEKVTQDLNAILKIIKLQEIDIISYRNNIANHFIMQNKFKL